MDRLVATLLFVVSAALLVACDATKHASLPRFSAVLAFGDSTVDTGNNNYMDTFFRADHPPYGRDFPGQVPTGRFSNGKLIPDLLASALGVKDCVPPFLDPGLSDDDLVTGVSFASAGSGYDNSTSLISRSIPVLKQIELFRSYAARLAGVVGEARAKNIIAGAIVLVGAGTNDTPDRRHDTNVSTYHGFLLGRMQRFVEELYNLGCRFMLVGGLPPVGCLPIQMTNKLELTLQTRQCLEDQNLNACAYNQKLARLLPQMQTRLPGAKISYADIYTPIMDMIHHPQKYGFVETRRGCCGAGLIEAGPLCGPATPTCRNPNQFLFWDSIHPTQSCYVYLSRYLLKQLPRQMAQ